MNAASIKSSFSLCRLPGDEPIYLAMLSMGIPALKLIVPKSPFWRKCIVFSAFSYLVFSKGLQRVILWLTAQHGISTCSTNKGSDSGFLLPILVFSR